MTILEKAQKIIYDREEEKYREYGDLQESAITSANIASLISNRDYTAEDVFVIMIAIKLGREAHSHKEDNLLDLVGYIAGFNDLKEKQREKEMEDIPF